jgi:Protein of unknown function (DUF2892)
MRVDCGMVICPFVRTNGAATAAQCFDLPQRRIAAPMQYGVIATSRRNIMTPNVGTFDRIIRIALGLALIAFALGYIYPGTGWNWVGWFGAVPLLTALFGYCPAYSLLGITTCGAQHS